MATELMAGASGPVCVSFETKASLVPLAVRMSVPAVGSKSIVAWNKPVV